jgi:2-amino-4-hydroxy-6-hydroxymethyldihydropteridine diphosphokinase
MNTCYLGLGSNQKCPERQIRQAITAIKAIPKSQVSRVSSMYWNKAWGRQRQQDFCNAVIEVLTYLPPHSLLAWCQKIENTQGRIRKIPWGPRTIDIDILLYGKRNIQTKILTLPHPCIEVRDFIRIPLSEITSN